MLGLDAECMARDVDESWPADLEGIEVAAFVANKKAEAYRDVLHNGDVLITGDTVVVLNGKVLEKPNDEAHACEMLRALSGETHTVASAVAVTTEPRMIALASLVQYAGFNFEGSSAFMMAPTTKPPTTSAAARRRRFMA